MRFSDTTRKILVKMFLNGMSIPEIADCYTTSSDAVEKMLRTQLLLDLHKESKK